VAGDEPPLTRLDAGVVVGADVVDEVVVADVVRRPGDVHAAPAVVVEAGAQDADVGDAAALAAGDDRQTLVPVAADVDVADVDRTQHAAGHAGVDIDAGRVPARGRAEADEVEVRDRDAGDFGDLQPFDRPAAERRPSARAE